MSTYQSLNDTDGGIEILFSLILTYFDTRTSTTFISISCLHGDMQNIRRGGDFMPLI
jgi:hypothetical protein